jgi:hypothetical protein
MEDHRNKPNSANTRTQIRNEADLLLFSYYRNHQPLGNKVQDAYYIQIEMQTMTAADISANRKVSIPCISTYKPAEFTIISIESLPKKVSQNQE